MTIQSLPRDILGSIAAHCDIKTLYNFRGTCRAANEAGRDYMSEEVAARVVFCHPERYCTLRWNALKESRKVTIHALMNTPELIFESSFPEQFRTDKEMLKVAFVAATMLNQEGVASDIVAMAPQESSALQALCQNIALSQYDDDIFRVFFDNDEFARAVVVRTPSIFQHLTARLRDNEKIADIALHGNELNIHYVSARLKNDIAFVNRHIRASKEGIVFQEASDQVRATIGTACLAIEKNSENLAFVNCRSSSKLAEWVLLPLLYVFVLLFRCVTRPFFCINRKIKAIV